MAAAALAPARHTGFMCTVGLSLMHPVCLCVCRQWLYYDSTTDPGWPEWGQFEYDDTNWKVRSRLCDAYHLVVVVVVVVAFSVYKSHAPPPSVLLNPSARPS